MKTIVLADIFGLTSALIALSKNIAATVVLDPYSGVMKSFKDEDTAYQYFIQHSSLDEYQQVLANALLNEKQPVQLVGFSIGASVIWNYSAHYSRHSSLQKVEKAILFYGAQIRHTPNIIPNFPIELILPVSEPHFSIASLTKTLSNTKNTTLISTPYLHGFMNRYSKNFNQQAYDDYSHWLKHSL